MIYSRLKANCLLKSPFLTIKPANLFQDYENGDCDYDYDYDGNCDYDFDKDMIETSEVISNFCRYFQLLKSQMLW